MATTDDTDSRIVDGGASRPVHITNATLPPAPAGSSTVTANQGAAGASAWPVTAVQGAAGAALWGVKAPGAPSIASGQVTAGAAATLVAARATRRSVSIFNTDATNGVYIGPATVTALNGMLLPARGSISVDTTALIQCIAAAGSPVVTYLEVFD